MGLFKFKDFFKKKESPKEESKIDLPEEELFNVEKFNDWFCNEYSGYDGRQGAMGIFLRTDKLSQSMITDWFDYLNANYTFDDVMKMQELIRKDWRRKLNV